MLIRDKLLTRPAYHTGGGQKCQRVSLWIHKLFTQALFSPCFVHKKFKFCTIGVLRLTGAAERDRLV